MRVPFAVILLALTCDAAPAQLGADPVQPADEEPAASIQHAEFRLQTHSNPSKTAQSAFWILRSASRLLASSATC
jgi:hypothetical protein